MLVTLSVDRGVRVPMSDGTQLVADVFRPARPGRYPVVVLRTPYGRERRGADATPLAEAGYAVVVQDVRGRYGSGGDFYPFRNEARDGFDTVEWAAEQAWSTGAVGLAGASYAGFAQTLAAREAPSSLRAWVPVFSPLEARQWAYEGGAFRLDFNLAWVEHTGAAGYFFDWVERRDDETYWTPLSGRGVAATPAPALVVGGWFDVFAKGTFALWDELQKGSSPHRLLAGAWSHDATLDHYELRRAWFDTYLRGESEPAWPVARTFVTGWNRWHEWDAWPPATSAENL